MNYLICLQTGAWFSLSMFLGILGVNAKQAYRPYLLVGIISSALLAFWNTSDKKLGFEGTESLTMFVVIYMSHITTVLCVEQYELPKKASSPFIDWKGGYNMLFNARWIGTHRQAPDIKKVSKAEMESQDDAPSPMEAKAPTSNLRSMFQTPRAIFLRNRVVSLCIIWAILQTYNYSFAKLQASESQLDIMDFLPTKETYFRRLDTVTLRETLIRAWLAAYWILYSMGLYTGLHDVLALIFVGSCFDRPEDWPPLFGNMSEATSIRNFWGKYWHRLVYRSYTSYGVWISKNVLRLPRNSVVGKMFINLYVFTMSGFAHAFAVRQLGFSCGFWEEVRFYVLAFVAVLLEGLVLGAFAKVTKGYKVNPTVSKTIGYVWVFGWLFTTVPKSQYPKLWCTPQ